MVLTAIIFCSSFVVNNTFFFVGLCAVSGLQCSGTLNLCQSYSIPSWKVSREGSSDLDLANCNYLQPQAGDQLFLYARL